MRDGEQDGGEAEKEERQATVSADLFHELPVGDHDLADALQGMHLDGGVAMADQLHGLVFSSETLRHTTTIGIEASPLSKIIQSDSNDGLRGAQIRSETRGNEREGGQGRAGHTHRRVGSEEADQLFQELKVIVFHQFGIFSPKLFRVNNSPSEREAVG
jgi:hypothetical protein